MFGIFEFVLRGRYVQGDHNWINNGIESYDKRVNLLFKDSKPSLIKFVTAMEKESRWQANHLDQKRRNHEVKPTYQGVTILKIPDTYNTFKNHV